MEQTDPVHAAIEFVNRRLPAATVAILGGSSTTEQRTAYSDLDVVIVDNTQPMPYRQTVRRGDWLIEAFVHNESSLAHYWRLDVESRRPALIRMCADGRIVRGAGGPAEQIQRNARELLRNGPIRCSTEQLDYRRYLLTDLLDDLRGCREPFERLFIANAVLVQAAELALLATNAWLGSGKWLARELHQSLPTVAASFAPISAAPTDEALLELLVERVLGLAGGPLQDGYWSQGELPQPS